MINRAILTGRLTRDVDLRYTQSGRAVGRFTIAVDRRFKDANGQRQADFINCVIWGKSAESFANFMHKGSLVGIEGNIQTGSYENKQGQRVFTTDINVDNWSFLESKGSNNGGNFGGGNDYGNNYNQNANGNAYNGGNANPGYNQGGNNAPQGNDYGMGGNNAPSNPTPGPANNSNGGNNAPQENNSKDPFEGNGKNIDISDDDLPF